MRLELCLYRVPVSLKCYACPFKVKPKHASINQYACKQNNIAFTVWLSVINVLGSMGNKN